MCCFQARAVTSMPLVGNNPSPLWNIKYFTFPRETLHAIPFAFLQLFLSVRDSPAYTCQVTGMAYLNQMHKANTSQFDPDCDCCLQSSKNLREKTVFCIPAGKILASPHGYTQKGAMFNFSPAQIGGVGVFHLLLFSCHSVRIHFHSQTIDEHLYSSIQVLLKHAKTSAI